MPHVVSEHPEIERYIDAMWMEKGLADNTLSSYRRDLRQYHTWLEATRGSTVLRADRGDLQAYLGARLKAGQSQRSTARFMSCIRGFYHFLLREGRITVDPTLDIDSPKLGRPLPKSLSEEEVDRLLGTPNLEEPLEFRTTPLGSIRPTCAPEAFLSVPSSSTLPMVAPDRFRMAPSASTRPMVAPLLLRTTPP